MAVKFMDHTPIRVVKDQMQYAKALNAGVVSRHQLLHYLVETKNFASIIPVVMENRFITAEKPFFNVYPKVADALSRTKLNVRPADIEKSIIHDLPAISIRLAKGSKESVSSQTEWFIISVFDGHSFTMIQETGIGLKFFGCNRPFIAIYHESDGNARLSTVPLDSFFDESKFPDATSGRPDLKIICRMTLGVMMLAADPDYIKPVLLKADEGKTTPIEERIARARNRGVYGFAIGEEIERCPHFRRPHFAIRWTGKGAEIPKLVPVKGAVVGDKKLLTSVPTGFENDTEAKS